MNFEVLGAKELDPELDDLENTFKMLLFAKADMGSDSRKTHDDWKFSQQLGPHDQSRSCHKPIDIYELYGEKMWMVTVFVTLLLTPLLIQGSAVCKHCDECVYNEQNSVYYAGRKLVAAKDVLKRLKAVKPMYGIAKWMRTIDNSVYYLKSRTRRGECVNRALFEIIETLFDGYSDTHREKILKKKIEHNSQRVTAVIIPYLFDAMTSLMDVLKKFCPITKESMNLKKALADAYKKKNNLNELFFEETFDAIRAIDKAISKFLDDPFKGRFSC
ncbi:hypothetical protein RB195_011695 [Necator americanus]|uniref:Nematode fatty acid retinoid binding protein n=1 Tax=Necator americanus TaxID=51031 RepID=A0ABR1D597_NECAM